jgi:nucleotide sugar dehydrogenase
MRVAVIGAGYVGLVSAVCLAERGHQVSCVDVDQERVATLRQGRVPFHEPGLAPLAARVIGDRLQVTTDLAAAVSHAELTIIAVGTPVAGGRIDLRQVEQAASAIGCALRGRSEPHTVVVKSTVVPGTTDGIVAQLLERESGRRIGSGLGLGMNPEFLREGQAVADFLQPDRIVIGGDSADTHDRIEALYAPFGGGPRIRTSNRAAEMAKYAANAFWATLISFSNEIGNLCAAIGDVDVVEVLHAVHLDRRIATLGEDGDVTLPGLVQYLAAGCGFGGSCFPKDVKALVTFAAQHGQPMAIMERVLAVNESQPLQVIDLLGRELGSLERRTIAVLGVAFKAGTDDIRESPALRVLPVLRAAGARLRVHDPMALAPLARAMDTSGITLCHDLGDCLERVDAVVILTAWPEYAAVPALLKDRVPPPLVVDGRRCLASDAVPRYAAIGLRRSATATAEPSPSGEVERQPSGVGADLYRRIERLFPICRSLTGDGVRETLRMLCDDVPLDMHEIPTGTTLYDWTVPDEWNIRDAWIKNSRGERVVDFRRSNLHVLGYSTPVHGWMTLEQLRPHLHVLPDRPDWIPYRTSYYTRTWGFCLTARQLASMTDERYEVCIDATLQPGALTYGECIVRGATSDELLVTAHVCHPSLANDNLSGIAVAVELARHVARAQPHHTHRFVFAPATLGAIAWLHDNEAERHRVKGGLVLAGLGDAGGLTYKASRSGTALVDRAVRHVLRQAQVRWSEEPFSPYGYDERQYGSPGVALAVGRLGRSPHGTFPEYHTSADDLSFVHPHQLAEAFDVAATVLNILDTNRRYVRVCGMGEPQLGRRGLFRSVGGTLDPRSREVALLWVSTLADGEHDLLSIAERAGLPFTVVRDAAHALESTGVVTALGEGGRAMPASST